MSAFGPTFYTCGASPLASHKLHLPPPDAIPEGDDYGERASG